MIDKEWLKDVNFDVDVPDDIPGLNSEIRVTGLLGVGSEKVVLEATDGSKGLAIPTTRFTLGYHISEVPPFLSKEKLYDPLVVCSKLDALVGRDGMDAMVRVYRNLIVWSLNQLAEGGVHRLRTRAWTDEGERSLIFFLSLPDFQRYLNELKDWPEPDPDDSMSNFIDIFAPNFTFNAFYGQTAKWSAEAIQEIENSERQLTDLDPDGFFKNPLFVWVNAVLEGFFCSGDELDIGASFIKDRYPHYFERDALTSTLDHIAVYLDMLSNLIEEHEAKSIANFLRSCGLISQVRDKDRVHHWPS